jgi:DNA replication licensing factor MCM7
LDEDRQQQFTYASARTLLGIIRMAQALARIRLSDIVEPMDVDEALRLIDISKSSLTEDDSRRDGRHDKSPMSAIFNIVKDLTYELGNSLALSIIRQRISLKGYTETQLEEAIREYKELDIWQIDNNRLIVIH